MNAGGMAYIITTDFNPWLIGACQSPPATIFRKPQGYFPEVVRDLGNGCRGDHAR